MKERDADPTLMSKEEFFRMIDEAKKGPSKRFAESVLVIKVLRTSCLIHIFRRGRQGDGRFALLCGWGGGEAGWRLSHKGRTSKATHCRGAVDASLGLSDKGGTRRALRGWRTVGGDIDAGRCFRLLPFAFCPSPVRRHFFLLQTIAGSAAFYYLCSAKGPKGLKDLKDFKDLRDLKDFKDLRDLKDLKKRKEQKENAMPEHIIRPSGNYRKLLSYQKTEVIYEMTYHFAHRFLAKGDRTIDQMVQAARSGKQNIIEGCAASATSSKTELKLVNVAKASLQELLEDYIDYLRTRGHRQWEEGSIEYETMRRLGREHNDAPYFLALCQTRGADVIANMVIILIHQADYLLHRQLERLEADFVKNGGFSERMMRVRKQERGY